MGQRQVGQAEPFAGAHQRGEVVALGDDLQIGAAPPALRIADRAVHGLQLWSVTSPSAPRARPYRADTLGGVVEQVTGKDRQAHRIRVVDRNLVGEVDVVTAQPADLGKKLPDAAVGHLGRKELGGGVPRRPPARRAQHAPRASEILFKVELQQIAHVAASP